jgi:hypothetical protein
MTPRNGLLLDADHRIGGDTLLADFFPWVCSAAPNLKAVAEDDAYNAADPRL